MRLIHQLGLYSLLLCTPPESWPLSQHLPEDLDAIGISAAETLAANLPRPTSQISRHTTQLDHTDQIAATLPHSLLEAAGLNESETRKRLYVAAALTPLRDIITTEKKKDMWLGDRMLRDVLGVGSALFGACTGLR